MHVNRRSGDSFSRCTIITTQAPTPTAAAVTGVKHVGHEKKEKEHLLEDKTRQTLQASMMWRESDGPQSVGQNGASVEDCDFVPCCQ
ncbi:hypothetical protein RRG08_008612 [Elysia crispata]|uniref:Uncharacterized protein n=1 Tax=Elysia crispata TaxID=231223 RepID=A0AAE1B764_9GAST|nr:hypothetical protein RRG08_008612 [Elysia crispata]